ncbi:hypothetical protein MJG53_004341 [Ovis ammon polii x Ovis aries]|uniref:Uncharacterized protein n=1 Tax=Ovis ammon polii x Ovis aries TaxID=2918886 RepID=A0ACB9VAH4_9CETA|nr:hypothetical protein MJG53_004341 [Ovis ammon polii x Ovis aries]
MSASSGAGARQPSRIPARCQPAATAVASAERLGLSIICSLKQQIGSDSLQRVRPMLGAELNQSSLSVIVLPIGFLIVSFGVLKPNVYLPHLSNISQLGLNLGKRILASLGDRLHDDPPQKPPRSITLREPSGNHTPPQLSPSLSQSTYTTGGSLDVPHIIMQGDARRRRNENYFDDIPRSKLERQMAQTGDWGEPSITLRPPNEATASTPVQYWQHHPEKLIFQSCDYKAFKILCTSSVFNFHSSEALSKHDACMCMLILLLKRLFSPLLPPGESYPSLKSQKSTEQMKKVPTIILSVSYKGVKFIDATNKNIIAEHEIRNISCAAQDPEDLSTFAYITKDLKSNHHYCHVFTAFDVIFYESQEVFLNISYYQGNPVVLEGKLKHPYESKHVNLT